MQAVWQICQAHHPRAELLGQYLAAFHGAVSDCHAARVFGGEVRRAKLDHFTCADKQHIDFAQVFKQLTRQSHGGRRHADAVRADFGGAADLFGDGKRALEHLVQGRAQRADFARGAHGVFHLPQDLRLAQNHRVQATGHAKRMPCRLLIHQCVNVLVQAVGADAAGLSQPGHGVGHEYFVGGAVNFGAVAGRENGGFSLATNRLAKTVQHRTHVFDSKGEATPQIEWCGGVVETERPNRHKQDYKI